MDFDVKSGRYEPVQPQLTALIDVCALLIIFLIAGTVFGASSLVYPPAIHLPNSHIEEAIAVAPQVTILSATDVSFSFSNHKYPVDAFKPMFGSYGTDPRLESLKVEIQTFLAGLEPAIQTNSIINLIADKHTTYTVIYDVVQMLRKSGFKSVLFISEANGASK